MADTFLRLLVFDRLKFKIYSSQLHAKFLRKLFDAKGSNNVGNSVLRFSLTMLLREALTTTEHETTS